MKNVFRNKKILKVIIILIVLSYFIYIIVKQQTTLNSYKAEQDYVSEQIQEQQEYKNELADMKANINSDEYIEQIARDKLDMYLPNERVYVPEGTCGGVRYDGMAYRLLQDPLSVSLLRCVFQYPRQGIFL